MSALVTGASNGIGEQLVQQLAGREVNLVLVARREDKLGPAGGRAPVTPAPDGDGPGRRPLRTRSGVENR